MCARCVFVCSVNFALECARDAHPVTCVGPLVPHPLLYLAGPPLPVSSCPKIGVVTVTAMCMDSAHLNGPGVFVTFGLSGQRNPPAVTAAVAPIPGERLAVWAVEDAAAHTLAFSCPAGKPRPGAARVVRVGDCVLAVTLSSLACAESACADRLCTWLLVCVCLRASRARLRCPDDTLGCTRSSL
jgi:hypothetical protein